MRRTGHIGLIRPMGLIGLIGLMALLGACSSGSESVADSGVTAVAGNVPPAGEEHAMGFTATFVDVKGQAAKASRRAIGDGEFTNDDLQASGFGVFCWYTGADDYTSGADIKAVTKNILMMNQRVVYDGGQWTYSPTKYWPLNGDEKLTLRAYAPYVSYQLQTDANGLPWIPVVVTKDDYRNGKQHDPLWGTGRLVNPVTLEYYPEPDPEDADQSKSKRYGHHYNNITYEMSGDHRLKTTLPADTRNGIIDWYFHHGMSKLMFTCSIVRDAGCSKVTINSIKIESLYTQGLLSLGSPTATDKEKPIWNERSGDMTLTLEGAVKDGGGAWTGGDLKPMEDPEPYPFVINITNPSEPTPYVDLLSKGLLIIPRDFTPSNDPLKVTITYSIDEDNTELEATAEISDMEFFGNTSYNLRLSLTPSTKALEITMVQSAFTPWETSIEGTYEVYNW